MSPQPENPDAARDPYRELFERSADAILIIEGETFVDCNQATVRMLRYGSKGEVLETHPSELSPPTQPDGRDSFEKANEMMAIAFERGSHRFEWDHKRADGEVFPVEVLLTAVSEPGRRSLHVVWRDITTRKHLEEELRQALKMEAVGKLTGGIAHDFNNLLVAILGHADLLHELLADSPQALEHVTEIENAGARAAELVRQLLAFGRKQQLLPSVLDLNSLTRELLRLVERLIGEDVTLVFDLSTESIPVRADSGQLSQVLLNLAANARDAMPDGGQLTIETSRASLDHVRRITGADPVHAEYAALSVTDTGCGMDPETLDRAFDPFFTTKETGKGSGLGLATVYGIVKQSEGSVSLRSAVGHGTRVEVLLPITSEPIPERAPSAGSVSGRDRGNELILVVEDEEVVARLVLRALEGRGYRVMTCQTGVEALEAYCARPDEIDLLVTDVIMPQMGGATLVAELTRLGHAPRVLFMSGYTDDNLTVLHELGEDLDVLEKPFDGATIAQRVRAALDR
ncbi:hybrid sensor histidine kinase/response regulator [Engelhardtia mirabilis]|uniref:histidine kinase n=1 Tax=Engelhardtia mirabilis TaxID=2528011 RepID=A0A518BME0_9BACT|nr:Blue-light-activated protein [Planctomycetes bacterium Pla133]QDV02474.1 Blue-light-activated protein [Planctomycetes bacterium Pla86]